MKNFLLLVMSAAVRTFAVEAQNIELGAYGGYDGTRMFNKNISHQGNNPDCKASFAPVFGIGGGYFFKPGIGIAVDVDYVTAQQKYTGKTLTGSYEYNEKLSNIEVPVMLCRNSKSGFYIEIGPKFSFLANAREDATYTKIVLPNGIVLPGYSNLDVRTGYKKVIVSTGFRLWQPA